MDHTGTIAMAHVLMEFPMLTALCKFVESTEWGWNKNIIRTIGLDQNLDELTDLYPNIFTEKFSIGTSLEGRNIWGIKISDNPNIDEDEPKMLILGQCHAEEIYGLEITIELIDWLLDPFDNALITLSI